MRKMILFAALATVAVIACNKRDAQPDTNISKARATSGNDQSSIYKNALMGLDSPFISIDSANVMLNSYQASISGQNNAVQSLIVNADALRYYLQNSDIKHVKLMFAHRLSYIHSGGLNQPAGYNYNALTIVIAGYGGDNNYIYSPEGAVLDFCQPCPDACPSGGTAAYNILPN